MARAYSSDLWSECEAWSRDRIATHQLERLQQQLAYVAANSGYHGRVLRDAGFEPGDLQSLDDLASLPTVAKPDYTASLEESSPWGSFLAAPMDEVRRVHFSSGTTSVPTPLCWTDSDLERWSDLYARAAYSQGTRETDVFQCLFNYAWFVGGLGFTAGYERIGATVIPAGAAETERQVDTIHRLGSTAVGGTPSFMLHMAETALRLGRPLADSKVRSVTVGGEPGGSVPATRARIEELWGAKCYDGYGSLEFQPIAWECAAQAGGHLPEDFLYAEVVDPETMKVVPDGTPGVLVLTHLDKQAMPFVRWWTGDIVVRDPSPCACGRTLARIPGGVRGRADDMLVVKGVNLFPAAVEDVVRRMPQLTDEYLIVVDGDVRDPDSGALSAIKLRVEAVGEITDGLAELVAAEIRSVLTVRAYVEILPAGTLERSTHKSKRLLRNF